MNAGPTSAAPSCSASQRVALGATAFGILAADPELEPEPKPAAPTSLTVNVATPTATVFARAIAATGTVSARDELIIGSDATGVRLLEVLVDIGSAVHKGQLLARADDLQLRAQLAQHDALLKQAQAELQQAEANLDRSERLKDSGVHSVETQQTRRTAVAAARAKVELSVAQRREIEVKLAQTRVVAPAAGIVARKTATVGAVVQPGGELFRLIRDGQLESRAELPSHSLAAVQPGTAARVWLDSGKPIDAAVRLIAPTIDAATRNGLVHVALPADSPLKAGAHAKGELLVGSGHALALPESSVLTRDGYAFVYVVGGDGIARLTRIETGARQRGMVEVRSGLEPKSRVVGTGAGFVKDGDAVGVAEAPAPAGSGLRVQRPAVDTQGEPS